MYVHTFWSAALGGRRLGRTKDFQGRGWLRGGVGSKLESPEAPEAHENPPSISRLGEVLKTKRKAANVIWVLGQSTTFFYSSLFQCGHQRSNAPWPVLPECIRE